MFLVVEHGASNIQIKFFHLSNFELSLVDLTCFISSYSELITRFAISDVILCEHPNVVRG